MEGKIYYIIQEGQREAKKMTNSPEDLIKMGWTEEVKQLGLHLDMQDRHDTSLINTRVEDDETTTKQSLNILGLNVNGCQTTSQLGLDQKIHAKL